MEPPGITRHRRPFLAPLWLTLLAIVLVGGIVWTLYRDAATTIVFLVQPERTVPIAGEERAQRLASMFGHSAGVGDIDALYASDDRWAQQAAAPLSAQLHRTPVVFAAEAARAVAADAVREHAGGTVLMVASDPALAQIRQQLLGAQSASALQDPDFLYVVTVPRFGRAHLARFRY
jgi:broad specificity phosphatase PhoE